MAYGTVSHASKYILFSVLSIVSFPEIESIELFLSPPIATVVAINIL
jgi:hypothetical protein